MKRIIILSTLVSVIYLFSAEITFAQAEARYKAGKMIEISDLLSAEETEDCTAKRYVGTISAVQYRVGKAESFTLKSAGNSLQILFSPSLYSERLTGKDAKNLPTLVARGKKTLLHTCGESGKIVLAMLFWRESSDTLVNLFFRRTYEKLRFTNCSFDDDYAYFSRFFIRLRLLRRTGRV